MIDFLKFLLETFPWIATPLFVIGSIVVVVLLILGAAASLQGRQFKVGPVTIGEKPAVSQARVELPSINVHLASFTTEQLAQIGNVLDERMRELRKEEKELSEGVEAEGEPPASQTEDWYPILPNAYMPPEPPDEFAYAFKAKLAIEKKLRDIVLSRGGAWAGHTHAAGETYYQIATEHKLIGQKLAKDIETFYWSTAPYLAGVEAYLFDDSFQSLVGLTTYIAKELDGAREGLGRPT